MSGTIKQLIQVVGETNVVSAKVDRIAYSRDLTPYFAVPDAIVFPMNTEQVVEVLTLLNEKGVLVTPRGGGASFQGSSLAVRGGILLDLSRMNKIIEISNEDMIAIVQPGVRYETFEHELQKRGLTFPHDVGSHDAATIGGILASDSNGHHAYRHGRVGAWIQGMEVVLVDGTVLRLGTRAPRYNMGYNLAALFAGSEGTLGIITEATLKLAPRMPVEATVFPTCEGNFVGDVQGFNEENLQRKLRIMERILEEHGGENVTVARDEETINKLWAPRLEIDTAIVNVHPGYREFGFAAADPCVPLSKQAEAIREIGRIIRSHDIIAAVFCHTGIGIIHPAVLIDPRNREHWVAMKKAEQEILEYVVGIGGVVTAEHGFGYVKNRYVRQAVGSIKLELDKKIKKLLDPKGILNPGKMGLDTEERDSDVGFIYKEYVTDKEMTE